MEGFIAPRYPILLLHGLNCRDDRPIYYFGRIPALLEQAGVSVYLGGQDAWGSIASNGQLLQKRLLAILDDASCEQVNIIAHSKGGLEARYLISTLGMGHRVASLTTIATPHRGCKAAQHWLTHKRLIAAATRNLDGFWRLLGDSQPDSLTSLAQLTPESLARFNRDNPDDPRVFYQSWGTALAGSKKDKAMLLTHWLLYPYDGETDGLVSPTAAAWGLYRGTLQHISHQDIVDSRQKNLPHFSITSFYLWLVTDLARLGF